MEVCITDMDLALEVLLPPGPMLAWEEEDFRGAGICALSLFLMSQLPASANSTDVAWRLALFGLGTGVFQSPNNSAVMGGVPRPHLGIASGILATMRNVGMVLGIATGGAVLYAFAPSYILQRATLEPSEAAVFLSGLKYAYITGAILTGLASAISLVRSKKIVSGSSP